MIVGKNNSLVDTVAKATGAEVVRINRTPLSNDEFYGFIDNNNVKQDGVFTKVFRERADKKRFIVIEGEQDACTIEPMNTILDDNKKMDNLGEMIPMCPNTRIIFELSSCDKLSPAFVSRVGVVMMENEEHIDYKQKL